MPLYDYQCRCGNGFEAMGRIETSDAPAKCPECGKKAKRVLATGRGGIQCDEGINIPWLSDATMTLQPDCDRKVSTRGEFKRYLKKHGIVERCG